MKKLAFLILAFCIATSSRSQQLKLNAIGQTEKETAIIDSIGYVREFPNAKTLEAEALKIPSALQHIGFFNAKLESSTKTSDSTFTYIYNFGNRTKNIHIYIGKNPELQKNLFAGEKDTLIATPASLENLLDSKLKLLERTGFSLAKIKLSNIRQHGNELFADLDIDPGKTRVFNDIVIQGYDKFPEGHKRAIKRLYKNRTFNQQTLQELYTDFNKFRFINQVKYPEILFTTDTTKVFVYLEKSKPSRFDGLIGFANDDENAKIVFSGYLDLQLVNFVNTGEEFNLYWKSDGKEQRTFNVSLELPYIFKSRFGIRAQLNIFKQDSTFQNTKTSAELGYFFNYNTRVYLGYQATESSDIQNQNSFSINDYNNQFLTVGTSYVNYKSSEFLFPEKTRLTLKTGIGSRKSNLQKDTQLFAEADLRHNFYLNEKNLVNIRSQDFYLASSDYTISELYRFGGINSIRGFNENSLQGNALTSILTEYRYILAPNLYVHSILDYGYYADDATGNSGRLLGLGFGFGLLTKTGLLNLVYANGSTGDQTIKLSNSVVQLSLKANF
ncbi:BamA/TamA family outer membrane protein [Flavobacterium silvaticum]|uniref:hypothetical protein n=1 Tax=Flavobacterium silvaticum TaxID=1852020 RepID=UPI001F469828|nr:hypothetical protein [Flavobacterium silvaticum]